jgi:hypothetical protein
MTAKREELLRINKGYRDGLDRLVLGVSLITD